ncbi:ATP-binding protein [Roseisalinus antarcticus]|uniref:histidine kinase n=1 Tax=Roseisalinus antarcticus TaxID=254357 RepID=A0A1Y5RBI8_9RHOB|nr:Blue-light-activated protein [Roseisalinus antarcticus]
MSQIDTARPSAPTRVTRGDGRPLALLAISVGALLGSLISTDPWQVLGMQLAAGLCSAACVGLLLWKRAQLRRDGLELRAAEKLIEHDNCPAFITTGDGNIEARNAPARDRFRDPFVDTLGFVLTDIFANPGAVLFRLQSRANGQGFAREDIVTRRGPVRLSVQKISGDIFLWRLDEKTERISSGRGAESLSLPMLTAGPSGTVLYMNEAFRKVIGGRVKSLDAVFRELPIVSGQLHKVNGVDGPIDSLVAEITGRGGRREIYLLPGETATQTRGGPGWEAIEELPVPLLKVTVSGEVVEANRQARSLLGTNMTGTVRLGDLVDGLGRPILDWLREAAEDRGRKTPEFLRVTSGNVDTFVQVALNRSDDGDDTQLIAVLKDVTEFKSLEAQFVQSQKMQAIGQLAGGVAHDFNNLLTAISGHCDLLLLRHDQGDADFGDLTQIHQNANRAASLVGQLLAFSRKQNLRPEELDLRDTLSDLTHLLNRLVGEKITLNLMHDPALRPIRADKRQLEQVLMNLVVNARDAMPGGGEIRIETENQHLTHELRRDRATVPAGDYVTVHVIDVGVGMSEDKRTKIFEPFFTTKRTGEGTGLGLSTAYGIVKQTGGFIFADSTMGGGTTFTLYFPVIARHFTTMPEPPKSTAVAKAKARPEATAEGVVLLVEDEAPVRAFASRALRLRGFTVLEADSAEAALDMIADPDLKIDIFVTDVVMPGKDGPTWVREALVDRPNARVIFVSGYAEDALAENQALVPNSAFLPKPFSLTDLTEMVESQLAEA